MSQSLSKQSFFTELKESFRLALPLIASYVVQSSSGFMGTLMIAHLSRDALAATALGFSFYLILVVFSFGLLSSVGILVAQNFGAKNPEGVRLAVSQGLWLSFITSVLMILILLMGHWVLQISGQPAHIITLAAKYLHAVAWCIIPLGFLIVMERFLISISRTRLVLWFSLIEVPLEIFMCYVLIFGKWGFPRCGITGVGYGFAIVFIALTLMMGFMIARLKGCREYQIFSRLFEFDSTYFKELFRVGWPIGCTGIIEVGAVSMLAFMMGHLGSNQLAAHQLTRQFWVIGMMFVFAIEHITTVRVGQAVGRHDKLAVKLGMFANLWIGFGFVFCVGMLYFLFPRQILGLDISHSNPYYAQLMHYTILFLWIAVVSQWFDSFRNIILGALAGLKDTRVPMFISFITFWLIGLPISYFLGFVLHWHGAGLWIGLGVGVAAGAAILFVRFKRLVDRIDLSKLLI